MDALVEATNMWNECDFDYYMQAFAPLFTTLSGFLGLFTSLTGILILEEEVYVYEGISEAAYTQNPARAGQYTGLWIKHLMGVELQDATIESQTPEYGTLAQTGGF